MVMPEDFGDEVVFTGDGQRYNVNTYMFVYNKLSYRDVYSR